MRTTFLGAHALPPEAAGDKDTYIAKVAGEMMRRERPRGAGRCGRRLREGTPSSPEQIAEVFDAAKGFDLPAKLHADQLSNTYGAALAASYGALSADHLEDTDEVGRSSDGARRHGRGAAARRYYFIREEKKPPVDLFREHGVRIAIATDSNPGTSPLTSLLSR